LLFGWLECWGLFGLIPVSFKASLIAAVGSIKGAVCQFLELLRRFAACFGSDRDRMKCCGGLFGLYMECLKFL